MNYAYYIGTYDVTVSQYVAFLNANDPTGADPLGIYNTDMSNATYGGVAYNASAPAGQMYSIVSGTGNHPMTYVDWFDTLRFANWMDNLQPVYATEPTASNNATENGAYTLTGYSPTPTNTAAGITRNSGAVIALETKRMVQGRVLRCSYQFVLHVPDVEQHGAQCEHSHLHG